MRPSLAFVLGLVCLSPGAAAQNSVTLLDAQAFGNFHAGGIEVTISGDADGDATGQLEIRLTGAGGYEAAHPLTRVAPDRFLGSLFWLTPDSDYDLRVTLLDPDGVSGSPAVVPLATRSPILAEPTTRTLYVAPDGDDQNAGTSPGEALATVQEAADRSQPGDLVLIAPGTYRESVTVSTSGLAGAPIVFRGTGPGAVLDGADEAIAAGVTWAAEGTGVFSRLLGFATGHVVTEAGRLFRYDSRADLEALPAGPPGGFWVDGTGRLFLKLGSGDSPELHTVHVARYENGLYLDGVSHVRVENLEIRHYGAGDFGKGVYLRFAQSCAVRSSRIHEVGAAGIWIKGGGEHLIEDNLIWDTSIFDWPWDWTKGSSAENNGIAFTDDVARGNVVRGNLLWGTFNGIGACGGSPPATGLSVDTDLYDNTLFEHTDDAFEPEGHCANVRLWSNHVEDSHMAFALAPAAPGPVFLVRNVAYRFGNTRTSQEDGYLASAIKINSGFPTPVGPLFLYHNTFLTDAPDTSALALLEPGESTFIRSRNNIFAGTDFVLYKVNEIALDFDSDALHTTHPTRFVRWEGTDLGDLPALQAATGQEPSGLQTAADLEDPASGRFWPRPGSPLVDAGVLLPGINDVYHGSAPDLGAVELGLVFADGFESGSTTAWSAGVP